MKWHPMRGMSLSIAVGRWARPHVKVDTYTARLCLGFVGITLWTLDLEDFIKHLADEAKKTNPPLPGERNEER